MIRSQQYCAHGKHLHDQCLACEMMDRIERKKERLIAAAAQQLARDSYTDGLRLAKQMAEDTASLMSNGKIESITGPAALLLLSEMISTVIVESQRRN